jgi:hypothetical protein
VSLGFEPGSLEARAKALHDLKAHLTVIVGYADLLLTRDDERIRREGPRQIMKAAELLSTGLDAFFEDLGPPPEA